MEPKPLACQACGRCAEGVEGAVRNLPQRDREVTNVFCSRTVLGKPVEEGESPVGETEDASWDGTPSRAEHVEFRLNPGRPRSKAKYRRRPIVEQYREGKVKSTPGGE